MFAHLCMACQHFLNMLNKITTKFANNPHVADERGKAAHLPR